MQADPKQHFRDVRSLSQRLRESLTRAARQGADIEPELDRIRRALEAIERKT